MKKLFKDQDISLYRISRETGIEISKLYRYANGSLKIEKMPISLISQLALYFRKEKVWDFYMEMLDYVNKECKKCKTKKC